MSEERHSEECHIVVTHHIPATPLDVWDALLDLRSVVSDLSDVRGIEISSNPGNRRSVDWKVWLKGFELQWQEEQTLDAQRKHIAFRQTQGMFATYCGAWQVVSVGSTARVELQINFDSGLPHLARFVNPVLANAFEAFALDLVLACARRSLAKSVA